MCDASTVVHAVPVKTTFRGTTDIAENFTKHITRHDGGELRNMLRGRVLIGREIVVPPMYALVCANFPDNQKAPPSAAGAQPTLPLAQTVARGNDVGVTAVTDRYYLWEHDRQPERTEALSQWIELSHAVHLTP